jgi:hypothetical protein
VKPVFNHYTPAAQNIKEREGKNIKCPQMAEKELVDKS